MRSLTGLSCAAALVGGSALTFAAAGAAEREVVLQGNAFDPRTVEIDVGDKIVWRHDDGGSEHSVTSHAGQQESFDSHPNCSPLCMQDGDTFERTFNNAGTFTYYCKIHGSSSDPDCAGMCGSIVVNATAPAPPPVEQPPATPPPEQPPAPPAAARATPTPMPTQEPTPEPIDAPSETPGSSPLPLAAEGSGDQTGGRGALAGIAVAAVVIAAGAGYFAWRRFGGAGA